MKKKFLALFLILGMMLAVLAGCGSSPEPAPTEAPAAPEAPAEQPADAPEEPEAPEEEPPAYEMLALPFENTITITIWDVFPPPLVGFMEGPWDCTANRVLEEAANVVFEYDTVSTEVASDQFSLMATAGSYCDFIYGVGDYYSGGADMAIDDEVIIDLKEMAECIPNYQALIEEIPDAYELTAEGNMYRFPLIEVESFNDTLRGIGIRGDWLDALNLKAPETYDELYETMSAFKTTYGGGTYLLDASGFCPSIGSGFGVSNDFYQIDGQVKYGPAEEGFKEYSDYVAKLWSEGLIYADFMTLMGPPSAPIGSGEVGVWTSDVGMWNFFTMGITDPGYYVQGIKFPTKTAGEKTHFAEIDSPISEGLSISTSCAQLDVMATLVNYLYSDEFAITANFGVEGEGLAYDENGDPMLSDMVIHNTDTIVSFAVKKYSLFTYFPHQDIQTRFMPCYDEAQLDTLDLWASSQDSAYTLPSDLAISVEDSDTLAKIMSDIETHVDEMLLAYVTGAADTSNFDDFVAELYGQNLQGAIDIYQAALDAYNK